MFAQTKTRSMQRELHIKHSRHHQETKCTKHQHCLLHSRFPDHIFTQIHGAIHTLTLKLYSHSVKRLHNMFNSRRLSKMTTQNQVGRPLPPSHFLCHSLTLRTSRMHNDSKCTMRLHGIALCLEAPIMGAVRHGLPWSCMRCSYLHAHLHTRA